MVSLLDIPTVRRQDDFSFPFDKFGIKRGFIYYYRGEISLKMERRDFFNRKSLPRPNLSILQMILVLSSFHFFSTALKMNIIRRSRNSEQIDSKVDW